MALSASVGPFTKHSARFACLDVGCKQLRTSQIAVWIQVNSPTKNEKTGKFERRCVAVLPAGVRQSSEWVFIFHFFVEDLYWENAPQNGRVLALCEICVFGNAHLCHFWTILIPPVRGANLADLNLAEGKFSHFPRFPAQCSIIHPKRGGLGTSELPDQK